MRKVLCTVACVLSLCLAGARDGVANGRFPTAQHVVVGPGTESDRVVLRATFGLLMSEDGGRSFHWLCEEGMFFPFVPGLFFDAPIEIAARGAVTFGYEDGIRFATDACKTDDVRGTRGHAFYDMTSTPNGEVLYAIEGSMGVANAVYRGNGRTMEFTRMGTGVRAVVFDTIEVAPSNPQRLYATGREETAFRPVLYRSDDGGETLTRVASEMPVADSVWISGVDPRDPAVVYARATVGLASELWRSRDAGRRFERIARIEDPMLGFALSNDGRVLWFGSIAAGLHRSDDAGETFRQVNRLPVLCLREHQGTLWACSDWVNGPFALGRSRDRGGEFEPVLRFDNPTEFRGTPGSCATRSEGAEICIERWPMLQRSLTEPERPIDASVTFDAARRDAARDVRPDSPRDVPFDASMPPPAPSSECGCRASGRTRPLVVLWVLPVLVFRWRRRRDLGTKKP